MMALLRSQMQVLLLCPIVLLAPSTSAKNLNSDRCHIHAKLLEPRTSDFYHDVFSCIDMKNPEDFQEGLTSYCQNYDGSKGCDAKILDIKSSTLPTPFWQFIPDYFPNLTHLYFTDTALNDIGEEVKSLKYLQYIHLSNNSLTSIRSEKVLRSLTNLTELHIEHNTLGSFTLSNMRKLGILQLNDNALKAVSLSDMDKIVKIDLSRNFLSLQDSSIDVPGLQLLNLSRNQLEDFNEKILFGLRPPRFLDLDLSWNRLRTLQNATFQSLNMLNLYMDHNYLTSLPTGLFHNIILRKLSLSHNNLTTISMDGFLKSFKYNFDLFPIVMDFSYNSIREIKRRVWDLNGHLLNYLCDWNFAYNNLRKITFEVIPCYRGSLNISHNQLQELNLAELTCNIDVRHNRIEKLFTARTNTGYIRFIHLDHNSIRQLSPGMFYNFPYLENLTLSYNKIDNLPHGSFNGLKELLTLDLGYNRLSSLHAGIFGPLHELETLILSGNLFTTLHLVAIANELPKLKVLDIDRNRWRCDALHAMLTTYKHQINRSVNISLIRDAEANVHHHNANGVFCLDEQDIEDSGGFNYYLLSIVLGSILLALIVCGLSWFGFRFASQKRRDKTEERNITEMESIYENHE